MPKWQAVPLGSGDFPQSPCAQQPVGSHPEKKLTLVAHSLDLSIKILKALCNSGWPAQCFSKSVSFVNNYRFSLSLEKDHPFQRHLLTTRPLGENSNRFVFAQSLHAPVCH